MGAAIDMTVKRGPCNPELPSNHASEWLPTASASSDNKLDSVVLDTAPTSGGLPSTQVFEFMHMHGREQNVFFGGPM